LEAFGRRHRAGSGYLLYVGRQSLYKNFRVLLEGWAAYRERSGDNVKLMAVSPAGSLVPSHLDFLIRHRLAGDFVMMSGLDDAELACAYAGARALVFPSLWEGFGIPVLEAAAAGIPSALSDIPAFREVAGDAAAYFDPYDPSSLAGALAAVARPDVAARLVRTSASRLARFSWDAAADHHAAVYRSLAAKA
jgi:glycosyltransferase involved in cell wall biosynthesis